MTFMRTLDERLDAVSRLALRSGCLRAWALLVSGVLPMAFGLPTAVSLAFTFGGAIAMGLALLHQDTPGRGSLNRWDEALVFNGIGLLAHMVQRLA
jgi:hypothetical protein